MLQRILPLLNRLLPVGLAYKGLQKIDPRIGKFLVTSAAGGIAMETSLDYLRQKFGAETDDEKLLQQRKSSGQIRPDEEAAQRQIQNSKQIPNAIGQAASLATGLGTGAISSAIGDEEQAQQQDVPMQAGSGNIIEQYSPELFKEMSDLISKGNIPFHVAAHVYRKYKNIIDKIQKDNKVDWVQLVESLFGQGQQQQQIQQQQQQQGGPSDEQLMSAFQNLLKM